MTQESAHTAHRALAHQIQAVKRHKARHGYVEPGLSFALTETIIAHWPAVQQALRDAARNEEMRTLLADNRREASL
jgi:hypothetical protein